MTHHDRTRASSPLAELRVGELGLVGNLLCPFSQRAQMMLLEAGLKHRRIELDFTDKPAWFVGLAPEAKIPLLVSGEHVVFGSGAIVEYLNDRAGGHYLPADAETRGVARSWCTTIDAMHDDVRRYFKATDEADWIEALGQVQRRLRLLQEGCPPELLDPQNPTLVGVYLSVLFVLLNALECGPHRFVTGELRELESVKRAFLDRPSVQCINSLEYQKRLVHFVCSRTTVFASQPEVQKYLRSGEVHSGVRNAASYLDYTRDHSR